MTERLAFKLENSKGYVDGSTFTDDDLRYLPTNTCFIKLENAKVTDQGIKHLLNLQSIIGIDLDSTKITDDALNTLSKMSSLREIWLEDTSISDDGLLQLSALKDLEFISVAYTQITQKAIGKLKAKRSKVEIVE